ncbi:thioredoxin [Phyllosticta citribraziliensis]|uniref:Thioredoxin n=1 Tax=Phyllosticta citribraziliensis TaxID=989973 RepID=A0ABR1LW21_9PEZI
MSKITPITSAAQFNTILSSHAYTVVDFYADWCGPCKAIAPIYAALATAHASPGRLAFVKVDVDAHQGIARQYGVSAMPTFLILTPTSTVTTIRGADAAGLRAAVSRAATAAANAPARASTVFQTKGYVLGDAPSAPPNTTAASNTSNSNTKASGSASASSSTAAPKAAPAARGGGGQRLGGTGTGTGGGLLGGLGEWAWSVTRRGQGGMLDTAARFVGLYFASLFSFDAGKSAEASVWNVKRR